MFFEDAYRWFKHGGLKAGVKGSANPWAYWYSKTRKCYLAMCQPVLA
jgi:hypothetical protein